MEALGRVSSDLQPAISHQAYSKLVRWLSAKHLMIRRAGDEKKRRPEWKLIDAYHSAPSRTAVLEPAVVAHGFGYMDYQVRRRSALSALRLDLEPVGAACILLVDQCLLFNCHVGMKVRDRPSGNKPVAPLLKSSPRYQPSPNSSSRSVRRTRSPRLRVNSSSPRAMKSSVEFHS